MGLNSCGACSQSICLDLDGVAEIGEKYLNRIESIILTSDDTRDYFSKENRKAYDAIIDLTVAVIVGEGTENSPELPECIKIKNNDK